MMRSRLHGGVTAVGNTELVVWLTDSMEIRILKRALGNCSLGGLFRLMMVYTLTERVPSG